MKTIYVDIAKEHIQNGKRFNPQSCPIALALIEKGFKSPIINRELITFYYKNKKFMLEVDKKVADFIYKYDRLVKVRPFVLELTF